MKEMVEDFTIGLLKTISVLRPYHKQIVIGGGWRRFSITAISPMTTITYLF